jgi:DNA invertase Pin-like site-specific DNA recombinase
MAQMTAEETKMRAAAGRAAAIARGRSGGRPRALDGYKGSADRSKVSTRSVFVITLEP